LQADKNYKRKLEEKEDNPTEMDTSHLNPSNSVLFTHSLMSESEVMEDIEEEDEELEEDNEVSFID